MPIPTPTCACEGREYISGSINAITNAKYFMSPHGDLPQIRDHLHPTDLPALQSLLSLKAPVYLNSTSSEKLQGRCWLISARSV